MATTLINIYYTAAIRKLFFFFFNDPATTEISPLPLPDALPIWHRRPASTLAGRFSPDSPRRRTRRSYRTPHPATPPSARQFRASDRARQERHCAHNAGDQIGRAHV